MKPDTSDKLRCCRYCESAIDGRRYARLCSACRAIAYEFKFALRRGRFEVAGMYFFEAFDRSPEFARELYDYMYGIPRMNAVCDDWLNGVSPDRLDLLFDEL